MSPITRRSNAPSPSPGTRPPSAWNPVFWRALETDARSRGVAVNALVAEIDAARLHAPRPPNLTSALRQYLFGGGGDGSTEALGAAGRTVEE